MTDGVGAILNSGGGLRGDRFSKPIRGDHVSTPNRGGCVPTPLYHGERRGSDNNLTCWRAFCVLVGYAVAFVGYALAWFGYLIAFLLCLSSMKPRTRVAMVWCYYIIGSGLVGGLLSRHYSTQDISALPKDMREITGISSVFCQSLSIQSTTWVSTYLFDGQRPVVDTSTFSSYDYSNTTSIDQDNYKYWRYYLLRDSMVTMKVCPDGSSELMLFIIKNKFYLDKWIDDSDCDYCYEERHYVHTCYSKYNYTISDSDDYYFLIFNKMPTVNNVEITFSLQRTRYDLVTLY